MQAIVAGPWDLEVLVPREGVRSKQGMDSGCYSLDFVLKVKKSFRVVVSKGVTYSDVRI